MYNDARPGGPGVDAIIHGQISHPQQNTDRFFTKQVRSGAFMDGTQIRVTGGKKELLTTHASLRALRFSLHIFLFICQLAT